MNYALKIRYIVTYQENKVIIIENGIILIDGNKITDIGNNLEIKDREVLEFPNHVVIPGFINTHSHTAMTLFRGYADDVPLNRWLNEYIWPMEAKLSGKEVEIGAKLAAIELILSGTTTVNSMYWYPKNELIAFKEIGVRLMSGPPIISGVSDLSSSEKLVNDWHGNNDDMSRISINPHAPYTVTPDDYTEILNYKNSYNSKSNCPNLKIHTHLAESKLEMQLISEFSKDKGFEFSDSIKTPTQYLDSIGILDVDLIAAHAVECNDEDLQLILQKNVGVSINTISNMKLGNGIPRIKEMSANGLKISLGTDGPAANNGFSMFETMKMSSLTQKSLYNDPSLLSADKLLMMATAGGADVLGWKDIGTIKKGNKADLTFINLNKPHLRPILNLQSIVSTIVYSANQQDVSDVMINGKWKMRDGNLTEYNIDDILNEFEVCTKNFFDNSKN
ncbi:MAG: 5-methylthioadenosine/S-adenosylhomocysteine deaminase [Candidatus Heimdallarchaeota archaeon LC_2]|nr:MAG: 5-methylthioadenosine/S-adenosylhomocysteine deaminase [Candidatus Heimdallarchaeota archaeon LC_2]